MFRQLLLCAFLAALICSCLGAKVDRQKRCGTDTDCVVVKSADGSGQLIIDDLDFSTSVDTMKRIEDRLPEWFGPTRPLKFTYKGEELAKDTPLRDYGIEVGGTVMMATDKGSEL